MHEIRHQKYEVSINDFFPTSMTIDPILPVNKYLQGSLIPY